jgi:hypothetical protein
MTPEEIKRYFEATPLPDIKAILIGGTIGIFLLVHFADKGWIAKDNPNNKHFYI